MSALLELLAAPSPGEDWSAWFTRIAERLLLGWRVRVGEALHTPCEIELYLHGQGHRDPFTHANPVQRSSARWYFHRVGSGYRGGTYKGLDITFGTEDYFGGVLLRSLRTPSGELVSGSSLCVEHMLAQTGHVGVAELDAAIGERDVIAEASPLALVAGPELDTPLYATARVGLTLKRVEQFPEMLDYIVRPYRFLTAPREIVKGRVHLIVALYQRGCSAAEIVALTGTPRRTVDGYIAAYERGRWLESTHEFWGRDLNATQLARLHGALRPDAKSRAAGAPKPR